MQLHTRSTDPGFSGNAVHKFWQRRFARWLDRCIPPARSQVLGHQNIFILPGKEGGWFIATLFLILVGAINFEANLAYALVFLLLGMFLISIFYCFRNLAGLQLTAVPGAAVFAGENVEITVVLTRHGANTHESIELGFAASQQQIVNLVDSREARASLFVPVSKRGYFEPGRLKLASVFPFGLCRAWSVLDLQVQCLVYPAPIACDLALLFGKQLHEGALIRSTGGDDFHSLREYQRGDQLRHVAWKHYARGQGLLMKEYASPADQQLWLRWSMFPGMDTESILSRLCWCAIRLHETGLEFGLEIPGNCISPDHGAVHFHRILKALAVYTLGREQA